jgi:hypothetical protein
MRVILSIANRILSVGNLMLIFQHLQLTSTLFWILLLIVIVLVLALLLIVYSITSTCSKIIMPSPEWVKETSIKNVQEFFTSPGQCVSLASKPHPIWSNKTDDGGPLNGNDTRERKDNNVTSPQKGSKSGNSSSDDSLDRRDHAPRVVAVAMKSNKSECTHQLQTAVQGKGPPNWTVKSDDANGIQPETSFKPVTLEQILKNGSSRKEQDFVEKLPVISIPSSLTHEGERKQIEKSLPIVSTMSESVNQSVNNLSTIIAVNSVGNKKEIHTDANAKLSVEKLVAENEPLSSTVIIVNCANSQKGMNLSAPKLPSRMKDLKDKSLVWRREIKQNDIQNQPAAGVKVTVSISSELESCDDIPPPIPPLPVSLRRKFFSKEGIIINAKEPQLKVESLPCSVNGKAPLPLNRLCLHPKIKLKSLHSSPPTFSSHSPSRIPKLCPTPTGLRSVDCLVSLYEDGIAAEQRRKEIQKEGEQKKKISRNLKQSWEELFKKYEALEKECDNIGSVTRTSECNKPIVSSVKKGRAENRFTFNHSSSFKTVKDNKQEVLKKIEIGRLKSAPCSLLHLKDAVENDCRRGSQSLVCRTNSEVNLCSKVAKEREWPKVVSCKEKTLNRTSSKSEKEINNNQVVVGQSGFEGDSVQCLGTGTVIGLGNMETGGIGVVRANTGRQVSSCRYRTELEV